MIVLFLIACGVVGGVAGWWLAAVVSRWSRRTFPEYWADFDRRHQ